MRQRRSERLTETIREEIDRIIHGELADPRLGFITVTRTKVSPDGTHAFIFYSILGNEDQRKQSMEAVESSQSYIRRLLAGRLRVRAVPELHFIPDESVAKGEEVLRLIRDLEDR
jgi:ribosome-binding factor A